MASSTMRIIIVTAVAAALALLGLGAAGSAVAQSSAQRLGASERFANRCDAPVSETDVRPADHQRAGSLESSEAAPLGLPRILLAR
jgi:hypothetical protein